MSKPETENWSGRQKRRLIGFFLVFVLLYAGAAIRAEFTVGRVGQETAFQRLLQARGQTYDWVILGASHALPLDYGGVPDRLEADTGQSAIVLADTGAGPVFNRFVFDQARKDIKINNLLYIVDSFVVLSSEWNEDRITDRKLLRKTPLRASTASLMLDYVVQEGVDPRGLLDYLTCFSKLNDPARFSAQDWRGAENFDRKARPSRYAVQQRIDYLYPQDDDPEMADRYLDALERMFRTAQAEGIRVLVLKMPLTDAFRKALPDEPSFDQALKQRIAPLGIDYLDFSEVLPDASLYFDTDHLNRQGVERFYDAYLRDALAPAD